MLRLLSLPAIFAALLVLVGGRAATAAPAQAGCNYPINTLEQEVRAAPVVVLADAVREQQDNLGSFATTLRVLGTLKGRVTTPVIRIGDLGHVAIDCQGGPRLSRGNRYVLFLSGTGPDANVTWSLVNAEGGVYQIAADGVRFPPQQAGGTPEQSNIPPAEFLRDVGSSLLRDNPAEIEGIIQSLNLPETVSSAAAPAASPERPWYERVPRREAAVAVAGGAIMLASLIFLLWRPGGPDPYRRP